MPANRSPLEKKPCVPVRREPSLRIGYKQAGQRLLDAVSARFTYLSRRQWQDEIAANRLLVNGAAAGAETVLAAGDLLTYRMAALSEPPVDCRYEVLHEDADLLVINKPAPLPCHPGGRFFAHTLWANLREAHGLARPCFVNRLDRETSGLVLVAKNSAAARHCQAQFIAGQVSKEYLVVVEGDFPGEEITARGRLGPDPASRIRKKVRFYPDGLAGPARTPHCSTALRLIARHRGMSLVAARPHTGRCHQIRATLLGLGFPVVGDKLYGVDEEMFLRFMEDRLSAVDRSRLRIFRQALHAASLRFTHPATGKDLAFSAPLPEALLALLEQRLPSPPLSA